MLRQLMIYYLHQPESLAAGVTQAEVLGALDVLPQMISPGEMGTGIVQQIAPIRTPQYGVIITWCAHPGIRSSIRPVSHATLNPVRTLAHRR